MTTLRDVAKHCGVSPATVSNVLNERAERVSAETREKVLAAVRELHYRPTPVSRSSSNTLTRNLAVICSELSGSPIRGNHYFGILFDSMVEAAAMRGWSITLFIESMWSDSGFAVRSRYDGRCDGLLMVAPYPDSELAETMMSRGAPIYFLGTSSSERQIGFVDIDNRAVGRKLVEHLLVLGHQRIAFFGSPAMGSLERSEGYREAMLEAGLEDFVDVRNSQFTSKDGAARQMRGDSWQMHDGGLTWSREFLASYALSDLPTAIVCWNDELARCLIQLLQSEGIQVPNDISVTGVDDLPCAVDETPSLTTIRQPLVAIGKAAVNALIENIRHPGTPMSKIRFEGELVCRRSTGPVAQQRFASAISGAFRGFTNGGTE